MEPGLAAAAYAAETALEGTAVAALVIAQPTAPLTARFRRIPRPSPALKRFSHTLNVVKGRIYIFGGDGEGIADDNGDGNHMHVVTLPTNLDLMDTDYQKVAAAAKASTPDQEDSTSAGQGQVVPHARAGHCASVIGERIYVFGGSSPMGGADLTARPNPPLEEDGKVHAFDTVTKTWEALEPNLQGCTGGVPRPRTYASSCSITHPLPIRKDNSKSQATDELMTEEAKLRLLSQKEGDTITSTDEQQPEGYGTVFVHGGYDSDWNLLRDIWAFDIGSRVWSRWPDLPTTNVDAGEGYISCTGSRLWRCGDGFGKMAYVDVTLNEFDDMSGKGELGVSPDPKAWQVDSFGVKPGFEETEMKVEEKMGGKPKSSESKFPEPRSQSALIPTTTGQGRDYLILFMGEHGPRDVLNDVWSFQIASEKQSAAAVKDGVRSMFRKSTGVEQWAKAHVPETTKADGPLDIPKGLSRFGSSAGGDSSFPIVIWGGVGRDGQVEGDGWILTLE